MNPQQGIMSLTKPKQRVSARDSRAVDQVLDNTTQMLGKLDKKTLGLLLQLTQYLKANKPKYKELMANLEGKGALPPGVFPDEYDPKFLSVFALSVAKAQQAKNGMAEGGIASIAQSMRNQGRGKDTMLAHISPEEAELLKELGGVGTINPATGLPEYGIFDDIGNALSGVGNAVGSVLKPVGDLIGGVLSSPLGMAAAAAAAYYFMGPSAGAVIPSVAGSALPGAIATEAAATALTPAAIEAGIGSAGYGYNASAAASGLFDPAMIGSGAGIGASSTDKLLTANLLKNVKLSPGKEEEQSDPNALIKMLMMFDMMNKQEQPSNVVVPALTETTSNLPYDTPKKPAYQQIRAAEGGLMTKHLGIGGLSAKRSQTDYAKNYLPGSGYRPGQGGVTYFTPMEYTGGDTTTTTDTTDTSSSSATDELLRQTLGRTGGGGGMDSESRAAMLADTARRMDEWEARDPEGYKKRNDWIGNLFNGSMLVQLAKLAAQGIDTVKQTWANERLKALGIDPKIVLANQNTIAGTSMQQALNSLGQASAAVGNYAEVGGYEPGSQEAKAAAAGVLGDTYGPGTPGFNAAREAAALANLSTDTGVKFSTAANPYLSQYGPDFTGIPGFGLNVNEQNSLNKQLSDKTVSPAGYTFQNNAVNNLLSSLGLPSESNKAVEKYLAENANIAPAVNSSEPMTRLEQLKLDYNDARDSLRMAEERRSPDSIEKYKNLVADLGNQIDGLTKAQPQTTDSIISQITENSPISAEVAPFDFDMPTQYAAETAATTAATTARINALREAIEKSPYEKYREAQEKKDAAQEEKNAAIQAALESAPSIPFSTSTMPTGTDLVGTSSSPLGTGTSILPNGPDLTGGVPDAEKTPETEKERLDQIIQSFLDATSGDTSVFGPAVQLAALGDYNLGEGETSGDTIGNYSMFTPKEATTPLGVLSTAAIQQAYPGAFDQSPLASLAPTPYSYTGGPSLTSIANSFGNEGSVWTNGEGNPWVGADGKFLLTSQGAAQNAFNESPAGQEAAMRAEVQSLQNRYEPKGGGEPQGNEPQGPSGGGGNRYAGGDPGPSPTNNATFGGWGSRDAGGDARGGYLQHGRFDQRMAHGGIANLQYNLGSYSDGGRLLKGPGDGVSDDIPATIGQGQPARLADGEFVIPARIVSELGNGSTDAGAKRLYEMMDRIQRVRRKTKNVAANTKAAKYLPA